MTKEQCLWALLRSFEEKGILSAGKGLEVAFQRRTPDVYCIWLVYAGFALVTIDKIRFDPQKFISLQVVLR